MGIRGHLALSLLLTEIQTTIIITTTTITITSTIQPGHFQSHLNQFLLINFPRPPRPWRPLWPFGYQGDNALTEGTNENSPAFNPVDEK